MIRFGLIYFDTIETVWRERLWPDRISAIETHSAMTWPYGGNTLEYDMDIFKYPASFFAV